MVTIEQRIGRFRLERALGTGAFSTVWLAYDEELDDLVALKILADNWSRNEDARRRFVEEARALRRLDGDRIVRVYELAHLGDGRPFMAMEFADRGTLEDRMRFATQTERPFSASEVAAIGIELAGCLASVHAGRIVHRDVKPSNILFRTVPPETREALRRTGRPAPTERMLLGDFGIARRMEMAGLTHVVGSPQSLAPQQGDPATAHHVDERADLYSAGVVLFELLDRSLTPDVPQTMAKAIRRAMATRADDRYMNAWELRQDLVRSLGEPASAPVRPPVQAQPGGRPPVPPPPSPPVPVTVPAASVAPRVTVPFRTDARPAASAGPTGVIAPPPRTDVLGAPRPASHAPAPPPAAPPPVSTPTGTLVVIPNPAQPAPTAPGAGLARPALPPRLGVLDTCTLAALAGVVLVAAALLPWRSLSGTGHLRGIDLRDGTVVFAAAGTLVLAAVIRWATRGKWGLRIARLLCVLAGLATLGAVGDELISSSGAVGALVRPRLVANLGLGLLLAPAGAILAFVAAGRAKRQLRRLQFPWLSARRPAQDGAAAPAQPSDAGGWSAGG